MNSLYDIYISKAGFLSRTSMKHNLYYITVYKLVNNWRDKSTYCIVARSDGKHFMFTAWMKDILKIE